MRVLIVHEIETDNPNASEFLNVTRQASDVFRHAMSPLGTTRLVRITAVQPAPIVGAKGRADLICQVHDEDDPIPGRICGRYLPCSEHGGNCERGDNERL